MNKFKSKAIAALITTALITVGFTMIGQASTTKKVLPVIFNQFKIIYNNQDVTAQVTPIFVDGRTYLPLRSMANLFNKNLSLNQTTISLSDGIDTTVSDLRNQISTRDTYIQTLTQKIASLENTISSLSSSSSSSSSSSDSSKSISRLEDDLNDDHDTYKDVDFDISLSGDKSNTTVIFKTDEDDWNDLSSSYQKKYLQSVVDDIRDEYKNAVIDGKVKDGSTTLLKFTVSSDGDIEIDMANLIDSLENKLEDKLDDDYFGTLTDIENDDLEIKAEGDTDKLTFTINIDFDDYEDEWDELADSEVKVYMKKVYDYITDQSDFEDTDVLGYFYDTDGEDNLAKLYNEGDSFKRY